MKRSGLAIALMLLTATPSLSEPYTVYDYERDNYERDNLYKRYRRSPQQSQARSNRDVNVINEDTNSCLEGSVIGGLLGAGLGAVLSRGNGRWIGVPVGGAAGALVGCQVDGG